MNNNEKSPDSIAEEVLKEWERFKINSNEEAILGSTKFYNDNVVVFNQLVSGFPSNLVGLIWGYKRKEFYNNEKKEMYEILNEK